MELKNKIALPEGLLKKMHLESVIISPINEQIAIVILSKKEQGGHILRIYDFIYHLKVIYFTSCKN